MRDEDILAELGFGPEELERRAQQTETAQRARWGASGVEIMNVPMLTPPFDPDDPDEQERTRRQLWVETVRHDGDARIALKFLGTLEDAPKTEVRVCSVCGKSFAAKRKDKAVCSKRCYQKSYQKTYRRNKASTVNLSAS